MLEIIGLMVAFYTSAKCISGISWSVADGESPIAKVAWLLALIAIVILAFMLTQQANTTPSFGR